MAGKKSHPSPMAAMDRQYQAEDDHRTMMRAAEIQGDRSRMAGVKRHQSKQEKALGRMRSLMGSHTLGKGKR